MVLPIEMLVEEQGGSKAVPRRSNDRFAPH
jgi:hypothetical protein